MKGIGLFINGKQVHSYDYSAKTFACDKANEVSATVPAIHTEIALAAKSRKPESVSIEDGHLFTPFYVLKVNYTLSNEEKEVVTCLKLKKI